MALLSYLLVVIGCLALAIGHKGDGDHARAFQHNHNHDHNHSHNYQLKPSVSPINELNSYDNCQSATFGNITGISVNLPSVELAPGSQQYSVTIPEACPNSDTVGVRVQACIPEQVPQVIVNSLKSASIYASEVVTAPGRVDVTAYCQS